MNRKVLTHIVTGLIVISLSASFLFAADISTERLKQHVYFLAADSLKGRKPGTPGAKTAAEYIRQQIDLPGVQFLGEDGFQYFQVATQIKLGNKNDLQIGNFRGQVNKDFIPIGFSSNDRIDAEVVFTGYGLEIKTDSLKWNDYSGVDVRNKWVLILRGHPEIKERRSNFEQFADLREKVIRAEDKGAAGVLLVSGPAFDKNDELIKLLLERNKARVGLPVLQINRAAANRILQNSGNSVTVLESHLMTSRKPLSFATGMRVQASVEVVIQNATTQNVVALLPGSDPVLKDEVVVLGAHYDHLGMGGPGSGSRRPDTLAVHNGADDNASGVAAILEIFRNLQENRSSLKRSVLFISFSAEEMGTIGSQYFVKHPLVDLKKIKFMFNLDMIGRMNPQKKEFAVSGTGTAVGLRVLLDDYFSKNHLNVKLSSAGLGPSDQASFYSADKPVLFFFTAAHKDYHTPDDDAQFINYQGIKLIANAAFDLLMEIDTQLESMAFQEAGPKTRPSGSRYGMKVRLGIMPDMAAGDIKGLGVQAITKGQPADLAGIQDGDIIVAIEGKPVNNIYDYMYRMKEFRPGDRISVEVLRGNERQILIVEL